MPVVWWPVAQVVRQRRRGVQGFGLLPHGLARQAERVGQHWRSGTGKEVREQSLARTDHVHGLVVRGLGCEFVEFGRIEFGWIDLDDTRCLTWHDLATASALRTPATPAGTMGRRLARLALQQGGDVVCMVVLAGQTQAADPRVPLKSIVRE